METASRHLTSPTSRTALRVLVHAAGHGLIFGCFVAAIAVATFDPIHYTLLDLGLGEPRLRSGLLRGLAMIMLCALATWGLTAVLLRHALRRRRVRRVRLRPARGTIVVETLIVLPIYLLFVFGLAQLTINSMAGLLATLGSYEAARTLAVWGPEVTEGRRGVTNELALDKARVAAASVLAPVVPQRLAATCPVSRTLELHAKALTSVGNLGEIDLPGVPQTHDSLAAAFDHHSIATRGIPKLRNAYCSVEVTVDGDEVVPGVQFTARTAYRHVNVVPLVGRLFGERLVPGVGFVSTYRRAYEGTAQLRPNSIDPACRFCPEWGNSVF